MNVYSAEKYNSVTAENSQIHIITLIHMDVSV